MLKEKSKLYKNTYGSIIHHLYKTEQHKLSTTWLADPYIYSIYGMQENIKHITQNSNSRCHKERGKQMKGLDMH